MEREKNIMEPGSLEALNQIHIGICILEMRDRCHLRAVFINRQMLRILGLSGPGCEDDPVALDYAEDPFSCVHPADSEQVSSAFQDGYDRAYFRIDRYRLRIASGDYVWISENVSLQSREGKVHTFCATYRDISEEVRLHYELTERLGVEQQLRAQADHANQMKSSFLSSVSHDMRTPLNAVLGYTSLALATEDPVKRQDYLEKISKSGSILKQLINDTLDLSRIESGKMTLKPEAVRLDDIIQKVTMTVRPGMDAKAIRFVLKEDPAVRALVFTDELRMQEIILNILSNAVKFTPAGGTIRFAAETAAETDHEIRERFIIEDSGIGMSPEFLERIYEPFAQERTEETAGIEGSGLGLTIVKRIIDMMHGTIQVRSAPGQGTCFTIELPLPRAAETGAETAVHSSASRGSLRGMNILVFEDNAFNAEIAKTLLEQQGAHAELAGNGQEGVNLLAASPAYRFDAILMDIRMPVMDGCEAARAIRAMNRPDAASIPIIAMSADAYEEDVRRSLAAGMNAHLAKPIDPEQLASLLTRLIGHPSE